MRLLEIKQVNGLATAIADNNGIFSSANDGGTIPTGFQALITDTLIFGTNQIVINETTGRVGFGLDPAAEKVEIAGAIKIGTASGTADGTIRWTGTDFEGRKSGVWTSFTASSANGMFSNSNDTGTWDVNTITTKTGTTTFTLGNNDFIYASTGDSLLLNFDSTNDRVGIGIAPTAKLQIEGNVGEDDILVKQGANFQFVLTSGRRVGLAGISAPSDTFHIGAASSGAGGLRMDASGASINFTNSGAGVIKNSGATGFIKINGLNSIIDLTGTDGNDLRIGTDGLATNGKGIYLKSHNGSGWVDGLRYLNVGSGQVIMDLVPVSGNVAISGGTIGTNGIGVLGVANGTAPTASQVDTFQMYSADHNGAGTATAHFRNEEGDIFKMVKSAAYTLNATAVLDRTLLASVSATTINNNNLIAAIITDLQNLGNLG